MSTPTSRRVRTTAKTVGLYTAVTLGSLLMVFPFVWMILSAFKNPTEVATTPPTFLPSTLDFSNFVEIFRIAPFGSYLMNSLMTTIACVLATQFTSILAAFGFSVLRFPGRDVLFALIISLMVVPFEMLIITNYSTITKMGLIDMLPALVVPFLTSPLYTFIIRNTFMSVPEGLYWSARIDGASNWRYLWTVLAPIAKPTIVTTSILNGIIAWNSFLWPLLVINTPSNRTLPLGLFAFITDGGVQYGLLMAAATFAVLPILLVFVFASNQIIRGIARGGIKG